MNDKYKDLTNKLTHVLKNATLNFLLENIKDEENPGYLINLILSGSLSNAYTCMSFIAEDHTEYEENVNNFINELTKMISSIKTISKVELVNVEIMHD